MVANIRDALVQADPAHAAVYEANASSTIAHVQTLDGGIRQQVATLPPERRTLVTSHETFGYVAAAYGFEILGTALGSLSTEVGDPSPRAIGQLVAEIQAAGGPRHRCRERGQPRSDGRRGGRSGCRTGTHPLHRCAGTAGQSGATYEGMMRSNVTTVVEAHTG